MGDKQHSESGRHRGQRRKHDRQTREYEERVYTGWHLSKDVRVGVGAIVAVVIIGLTGMFMLGMIRW